VRTPGGSEIRVAAAAISEAMYAVLAAGGQPLLMCAAPDFGEDVRGAAHEAILLTATVDVPRAGLPWTNAGALGEREVPIRGVPFWEGLARYAACPRPT
jgi:hypothetical protein